ncbi:MAG: hypothetical protein U0R19_14900 [Bryobacteraceae bacterium]
MRLGYDVPMWPRCCLLVFAVCAVGMAQIHETVVRVAETQAMLPWFWSPPLEGFREIPYTFQSANLYRVRDARGKDKRPPLTLLLERTAVIGGIFNRCLAQNGTSPCSAEMLEVYKAGNEKAGAFPPEEKAALRQRRRDFWREFPEAFRFEAIGTNGFRFRPAGKQHSQADSPAGLLGNMQGEVRFDPRTYEITLFEYEVLHNVTIPGRQLPKTAKYSITLSKSVDGHYLPERLFFDVPRGKDRVMEWNEYSKYRRFAVESEIQFGDR